ncbi:zinc finger protein RFP-like isoform X2 [Sceloporus undulatus]|uniref:zinc finger protein RFP-like isoform X1 n=1 Tax=Sceloporus undulatus TaxID=8520 RepID=UPI001C4D68BA|nr:zinc finger protein RFP-like isoform X1 [Sceloporus undulatus]XP_042310997.1 zinc finger protein RFP-like isoform X2 [Sceloporus undulatus]
MAALNPEKSLQDEATCPICLDYFQSPMMIIDCGHNFCQGCITQYCEGSPGDALSCPQCRNPFLRKNLQPNRHLLNIVALAKGFGMQRAKEGEQKLCEKHQEPLKLFCEEDQVSICVVCDRSRVHKNHSVIPMEEAAQLYKEKIECCLQILKKERGKILSYKSDSAKSNEDLLSKIKNERKDLVSEFQQLRQVLEKEEQLLLVQLEELEAEAEKKKAEANELSAEISHLDILIGELEKKYQESTVEMLQSPMISLTSCNGVLSNFSWTSS